MADGVKLDAKWMLNAAMLSQPVDLTAIVTLSKNNPEEFFKDDDVVFTLIHKLLNNPNSDMSDMVRKEKFCKAMRHIITLL